MRSSKEAYELYALSVRAYNLMRKAISCLKAATLTRGAIKGMWLRNADALLSESESLQGRIKSLESGAAPPA